MVLSTLVFSRHHGPLERNARARVDTLADAHHRAGRLTHTARLVLAALLRTFQNRKTGRIYPTWETIAEASGVARASVGRALKALESLGLLTWVNRLQLERVYCELTGRHRWRAVPTSNAYVIHDPVSSKYQHETQTQNPSFKKEGLGNERTPGRWLNSATEARLHRLGAEADAAFRTMAR
jgi:DNA-binding MarR family transcriptional regulator